MKDIIITKQPRPSIKSFAKEMELAMQEHDPDKGDSWKGTDISYLLDCLDDEYNELKEEVKNLNWRKSCKELVDMANFCMMVYHRLHDENDEERKTSCAHGFPDWDDNKYKALLESIECNTANDSTIQKCLECRENCIVNRYLEQEWKGREEPGAPCLNCGHQPGDEDHDCEQVLREHGPEGKP